METLLEELPENITISSELTDLLPYSFVKENKVLPLEKKEGKIFVALSPPFSLHLLEKLRFYLEYPIVAYKCSETHLKELIQQCYCQKETKEAKVLEGESTLNIDSIVQGDISNYDLLEDGGDAPVIRFINAIISEAIEQRASDIHIDPLENGSSIRYRIDGILYQRHTAPKEFQSQLISRIKVMARLDVTEKRLPQDGRINLYLGNRAIDFRISTIPVVYGERIVLRILDKSKALLEFNSLGMPPEVHHCLEKLIQIPEGIIFITGPTGSGKNNHFI